MPVTKKHVLVVDDDATIRRLEAFLLERSGYAVSEADGGADALGQLSRGHADLVLLDLLMPEMDGWQVLEQLATMADPPRVIIVTGAAEISPPGHLVCHIAAVVRKPFGPAELLTTCEVALAV